MKIFKKKTDKESIPIRIIAAWLWDILKENRMQALINTTLGVGIVLLELMFVWATKFTIDIATLGNASYTITNGAILLIVILFTQIIITFISKWIRAILGVKAQNQMQKKLFEKLLNSEWQGLENYHSGDILNRIERDVTDTTNFLTEQLPQLITIFVQLIGAFLFLFVLDKNLACIVVIIAPIFILLSKLYIKKMRNLTHEIRNSDSKIQSILQESVQHRMVIKTLERSQTITERLASFQKTLRSQVRNKTKYAASSSTIMSIGFSAGYLVAFLWGVSRLESHEISYGAMIAFIQLVGQIQRPVSSLTKFVPLFISVFTASERLIELDRVPQETKEPSHPLDGAIGIRYENVTYSYIKDGKKIFDHFSYDFSPNGCIAILGETGAGKTTLVRLMLSLIRPNSGNVILYNHVKEEKISSLSRCNFAYVPQGNTLFSGTILENLLLGNPTATDKQIKDALKSACAEFVFKQLPLGIETRCGEQGYGLSEGQAQRICIARALLRNCKILLLDEATSALDGETEEKLIKNIIEANKDRTLIFVTHRTKILDFCSQTLTL
ncbi:MAG: ABC transporter ATP-binding protein [Bacteroidaceae bacterium]